RAAARASGLVDGRGRRAAGEGTGRSRAQSAAPRTGRGRVTPPLTGGPAAGPSSGPAGPATARSGKQVGEDRRLGQRRVPGGREQGQPAVAGELAQPGQGLRPLRFLEFLAVPLGELGEPGRVVTV